MFFSKSFGYALRGILYVAYVSDEKSRVQIDEISARLNVHRHFLGKIMKKIVKNGILDSARGPNGGYSLNDNTLSTTLIELIILIDGKARFERCALHFRECDPDHPCPLHMRIEEYKGKLVDFFTRTTIGKMMAEDTTDFVQSIAAKRNVASTDE